MNINYLKIQLKTRNISIYKLSKLTGLDDGMLNRIINGKTTKPQITTIVKIAKALDLTNDEFAELCGYRKDDKNGI
ncbi:helix-turn-helix domain-containing protein [Faecalibacillus intestinalis]|uniref:helix-turn-helix domain-containing protein n=1 Tax=Faecalibacillus intestinalis TaxID=1982626 RepID=UPI000E50E460|nr:helix-turn-helix transcriptional regulator [Faecalibacillus intestinalis]RGF57181.1 XRE family transcriptional regulator [Coprobacillus sp. AF36-10BH]RHP50575.1 XRE family transcriptional regulator [Coprobacillus sp. AF31-1BH]